MPPWTVATNQYPAPFNNLGYFHNHGNTANYDDPVQVTLGDNVRLAPGLMSSGRARTTHCDSPNVHCQ